MDFEPKRGEQKGAPEEDEGVKRRDDSLTSDQLRTITGLVAVVTGIIAVAALTVVTVNLLGTEDNKDAIVAITTSAFGIVSTVVTAFLGIRATANASASVNKELADLVRNPPKSG
ncbi:MAG: hypothetical protein ACTHN7_12730 [Solirubrobacterales bacterium]